MLGALANQYVLGERIRDLDVEIEASLNNWLTVTASFVAALAAAYLAGRIPARRLLFLGIAASFLFFSIDDQVRIHERSANRLDSVPLELVIFAPIYAAAFGLAWLGARSLGMPAGRHMRTGLCLLATAVVIDLATPITHDFEDGGVLWPQEFRVAVEEGFEVAGWLLIASAAPIALSRNASAPAMSLP